MKSYLISYYIAVGVYRTILVSAFDYNSAKKDFYQKTLINTIIYIKQITT